MGRTFFLLIVALLYAVSAKAQIQTVQHASGFVPSSTSVAVPFKSNVTAGDVLFVTVSTYANKTLSTPTDSQANAYTLAVTGTNPGNSVASIYVGTAKSTGADTVTCHIGASDNIHCHIYEVKGVTTTLDSSGTQLLTGTALSVSTASATTNASDYVLSFFAEDNSQHTFTVGAGYGDAETTNSPSSDSAFSEDKVVATTGVQTATATSSSSGVFVDLIVAFKGAGTTGPTLTLAPASLAFTATAGMAPANKMFNISMSAGSWSFSTSSDAGWLSVLPTSGTVGTTVIPLTVSAASQATCPQSLTGHITVTAAGAGNSPQVETVTYAVNCIQHTVQLSWTASATPPAVDGYNVYRYTAGAGCTGSVTKLKSALITTTTFADNTVASGSSYCYYSTASSSGVESSASNTFSVSVPTP
jgi:hypothetical protein